MSSALVRCAFLEADWSTEKEARKLREQGIDELCFALMERDYVRGAMVHFRYRVRREDSHLVDQKLIARVWRADGAIGAKFEATIVEEGG
jgi:hypothetical protein